MASWLCTRISIGSYLCLLKSIALLSIFNTRAVWRASSAGCVLDVGLISHTMIRVARGNLTIPGRFSCEQGFYARSTAVNNGLTRYLCSDLVKLTLLLSSTLIRLVPRCLTTVSVVSVAGIAVLQLYINIGLFASCLLLRALAQFSTCSTTRRYPQSFPVTF